MAHTYTALSAATTVLASELNGLANNALSGLSGSGTGVALDTTTAADLYADIELVVTFGAAPTAGASLDLYAVSSHDGGATYAQLAGAPPVETRYLLGSFPVEAVTTAQRIHLDGASLAAGAARYKFALHNNGTGQALAASGNTCAVRTFSMT